VLRVAALGEVLSSGEGASLRGTLFADYASYKLGMTIRRGPEVLVLGSSRVMHTRAALFSRCASARCFYNAGGGMPDLKTGLQFFRELVRAGAAPRVLMVGVDTWDFNAGFAPVGTDAAEPVRRVGVDGLRYALAVAVDTLMLAPSEPAIRDLLVGRTEVPPGVTGIAAITAGSGFRPDGSYVYSRRDMAAFTSAPGRDPVGYADVVRRCGNRFECPARGPDQRAVGYLTELFALARDAGTTVVVYTPVFADEVAAAIDAAQPRVLPETDRIVSAAASRFGFPFFAVKTGADLGCERTEFFDGTHGSEVCDARLLLRMLADPRIAEILGPYASAEAIRALVDARASPLLLLREGGT